MEDLVLAADRTLLLTVLLCFTRRVLAFSGVFALVFPLVFDGVGVFLVFGGVVVTVVFDGFVFPVYIVIVVVLHGAVFALPPDDPVDFPVILKSNRDNVYLPLEVYKPVIYVFTPI